MDTPVGEETGPPLEDVVERDILAYEDHPDASGTRSRRKEDVANFVFKFLREQVEPRMHPDHNCFWELYCHTHKGHGKGGAKGVLALWDHYQPHLWNVMICPCIERTPVTQEMLLERWGGNPFDEIEDPEEAYDYELILRWEGIHVCGQWELRLEGLDRPARRAERFKKWAA